MGQIFSGSVMTNLVYCKQWTTNKALRKMDNHQVTSMGWGKENKRTGLLDRMQPCDLPNTQWVLYSLSCEKTLKSHGELGAGRLLSVRGNRPFCRGVIFKILIVFGGSLSEKEAFTWGSFS